MHLLYEEDGELKAGTVLERSPASFHVESPHGRRSKIKAANVLLAFERPAAAELLGEAEKFSRELEVQFLWECSGAREFGFEELARDYVGRAPTPVEAAGVLMRLHAAPMYFYRRGKGRFQAAPEATLKLALASAEKKKRIQEQVAAWAKQLEEGACPAEIARLKDELLYAPDRNRPETRALEQACAKSGLTAARLFERCGLLADSHDYHLKRFLHEFFPRGTEFPAHELPPLPEDLPRAPVGAFSLDDVGTTEIDDAFSVQTLASGGVRVGIHIAAPALGFLPGSPLDAIARERLSTAYMPGRKFTMLPEDVIECFSLDHGGELPAISLYVEFAADYSILARHSRLERVPIVANLRHADYDVLNESFGKGETRGLAYETELKTLWRAAEALEARRGKPAAGAALDYTFYVEDQRVRILPRKRGVPLDKLVSEMMILANSSWGELLAERDVAAIYRVQSTGKVRFSVHAEPHEGLGVAAYAWMSSPLRRYVDLVNQWQLAAALGGRRAPFGRTSDALLSALRAFELTYARYDEHQRAMETYWSLRWLQQEAVASLEAVVLRENVVRIDGLPLVTRVSSLPSLEPLTRVRLEVTGVDLIERTIACAYRENLGRAAAKVADSAGDAGQKAQNMKGL
ncbi:MAG TPA: RNB domain-containing ribonuclease [Burkholderiales bacterium]|nr:RNB domain-containing ribonuclease [Burkholderiales bacterium]